jgi:hypothetical protein
MKQKRIDDLERDVRNLTYEKEELQVLRALPSASLAPPIAYAGSARAARGRGAHTRRACARQHGHKRITGEHETALETRTEAHSTQLTSLQVRDRARRRPSCSELQRGGPAGGGLARANPAGSAAWQSELVHVCNVLEAMEEKCKGLEATQIGSNVLNEAHASELVRPPPPAPGLCHLLSVCRPVRDPV